MLKKLGELRIGISQTYNELADDDKPEFKKAFDDLQETIENYEDGGCELYAVQEVIDDPEDVESSEDIDAPDYESEKRPFRFGNITKRSAEERRLQEEAMNTLSNPFEIGEEE
jgi:hypothetical protein